jgi:hypothetical protein
MYLDRTVSVRQLLKIAVACSILGMLAYAYLVWNNWYQVNHGGVSIADSPYRAQVPAQCMDNIDVHRGPSAEPSSALLLAPRTFVVPLKKLLAAPNCSGYQLLTGLHGDQWASFRIIYTDARGKKLVTRTVEYLKK